MSFLRQFIIVACCEGHHVLRGASGRGGGGTRHGSHVHCLHATRGSNMASTSQAEHAEV